MKIIKYILLAVILIILYITEPLGEPQFNTNIIEETLQKVEEDFGKNLMLDMSQVSKNL